jgi:ABC-type multidrug transport system ATPase subunit
LARALYAKPPVLIVDDILSSLDKVTQKHVWDNVFGPGGLVRRIGSVAVVATHASKSRIYTDFENTILIPNILSVALLTDADHVIVMDNRRISQQGPPSEVQGVVASQEQADVEENDATNEEPEENKSVSDAESEMDQEMKDLICSTGDRSLYRYYLKSIGWKFSLIGIGFSIGENFFSTFDRVFPLLKQIDTIYHANGWIQKSGSSGGQKPVIDLAMSTTVCTTASIACS